MAERISLLGVNVDVVDMSAAINTLENWLDEDHAPCRFVVTPNVDHVVMLQQNRSLRAAYDDADLVLADGFPLVLVSKLLGQPLPERVAGSELVPALFQQLQQRDQPTRVYLLGAMPGVALRAARRIEAQWPKVEIVGTYSPPLGFEKDDAECGAILTRIEDAGADVVIVGVGAPKQELWAHRFRNEIKAKALLCAGATIDFLAGEKPQAPIWMRQNGLEWLHRLASEPKRLAGRYARDAVIFPQIVFREWSLARRSVS